MARQWNSESPYQRAVRIALARAAHYNKIQEVFRESPLCQVKHRWYGTCEWGEPNTRGIWTVALVTPCGKVFTYDAQLSDDKEEDNT